MINIILIILVMLTSTTYAEEIQHEDFSVLLPPPPIEGSLQQELDELAVSAHGSTYLRVLNLFEQ